jgi:acyl-CoA thioester hydrolase
MSAPPAPAGAHRTPIQTRFGDTDALGHLNNASYAVYAEVGRLAFLEALGTEVRALILARLEVDFRRQTRFGEPVDVDTWVERVGTTSVTLRQHVRAAGAVAAEVRSVVVHFDYAADRPAPWPDPVRAELARRAAA